MLPFVLPRRGRFRRQSPTEAEDWYDLACELETKSPPRPGRPTRARWTWTRRTREPGSNLGRLIHEAGHPLAAASHYQQAPDRTTRRRRRRLQPRRGPEDLGRDAEAIAAYDLAITADPAAADAHFNLARLYEKAGQDAAAIRHLKAYRKLTLGR